MLDPISLLEACQHCYDYPMFRAGPDGRDIASVVKIDGETVLVFGGTQTTGAVAFLDWLNDLRAELVYREQFPGLVHHGFAESLLDLWPVLPYFDGPLTITGHSKGGALAVLMGCALYKSRRMQPKVVMFAAPLCLDGSGAACADDWLDIDSYVNPHDLVPKLPPVEYARAGYLITPPARWTPPRGIEANHSLARGYRPWIEMLQNSARTAAA